MSYEHVIYEKKGHVAYVKALSDHHFVRAAQNFQIDSGTIIPFYVR